MVSTDASSVMSAQNQAMQVKIDSLRAVAVAAAKATTTAVKPPGTCKKEIRNDNNIAATSTHPYKKRSVHRYTHDNHCCSFDITADHVSTNCKWKSPNYNDTATVTNRLGGISKNCFHYKGTFTAWWRGRTEQDNNKANITKNILNNDIPLSLCDNISYSSITQKIYHMQ